VIERLTSRNKKENWKFKRS